MLERLDQKYFIRTTNPIRNNDVAYLKEKIDQVNGSSSDELRQLYRQTIMNGQFTDKGGAGLGLIEMVKISNNPLQYKFDAINEEYSLYNLIITFS
jgi:hypothetical protein